MNTREDQPLNGSAARRPGEDIDITEYFYNEPDTRMRLEALDARFKRVVRRQPMVALAGALVFGLFVGRVIRR